MTEKSQLLDRRYDFVFLFDVTNGNPNGDPDAGNAPRIDPETGHGFVSDVCLKRKIRDFVTMVKRESDGRPAPSHDIYVKHGAVLNTQHQRAYDAEGLKADAKGAEKAGQVSKARAWMCQTFFDIRAFGAVMTTDVNCGQVRGPVQLAFARSVDPITPLEQSLVRKAVTTQREADGQIEKHGQITGTMGRKELVPYALYVAHGFISPYFAADTGFTQADLALLWQALQMMFEHDRSATRGEMSACRLIAFEHESMLGNAPAHRLFERVAVSRKDETRPARKFTDYEVTLDEADLPAGVKVLKLL
ncbi:MAG: type I-C CRISPR-associated protein Cas7/Csd2 [Phycisphaerae bacterium]|mgnify:CR=1 FL=1|nr:type I-C CRISPR-associated protein Cas7/Csd2 [Phycisphaerae bacterium]